MKGCAFLILGCILLWLEVSLTTGQDYGDCPYNEVEMDCVTGCNSCEFVNKTCQTTDECEPGCDCKDGYLRNKFGYCIPRRYCGKQSAGDRVAGEAVDSGGCPSAFRCRRSCRRRGFSNGVCTGKGFRQCQCRGRPRG